MIDVLNLALPYFGLIFIGFACGKLKQIPDTALAWMNFFIVYVALPALFYRILAQTPLEQLAQVDFIFATTLATFWAFAVSFAIGMAIRRGNIGKSTIAGLAGGYGNIGYMGPGLALATLGPQATVPVALIFCFDTLLLFSLVPFLMALANPQQKTIGATAIEVAKRIATHPLVIATADRHRLGGGAFPAARRSGKAAAILAECRCALRAVHARRHRSSAAAEEDAMGGAVPCSCQTRPASFVGISVAVVVRAVRTKLGLYGGADGGIAAGAQCFRVRAAVRYMG